MRDRAALGLNRHDLDRLAGAPRGLGEALRHDLLAAERDDEHGADVGMPAVGRERVVRDAHVGPELPAAGEVRQAVPIGCVAAATRSATTDEQITVGTTSTWLRVPTRPSGRR